MMFRPILPALLLGAVLQAAVAAQTAEGGGTLPGSRRSLLTNGDFEATGGDGGPADWGFGAGTTLAAKGAIGSCG